MYKMGDSNCLINAVIVGVLISLVLPKVLLSFAEPGEVKQPQNLDNATMKHKLMHLMAHKAQMPVLSAIIVGSIVAASLYIGYMVDPMKYLKKI